MNRTAEKLAAYRREARKKSDDIGVDNARLTPGDSPVRVHSILFPLVWLLCSLLTLLGFLSCLACCLKVLLSHQVGCLLQFGRSWERGGPNARCHRY